MKKITIVILVFTIVLISTISGCKAKNSDDNVRSAEKMQIHTPETVAPTEPQQSDSSVTNTDSGSKDYSEIGFKLEEKEKNFIFNNGLLSEDVVSQLGEPENKSEKTEWGADGLEHQTWYYESKGLEVDFVSNGDNGQVVNSILIDGGCTLKTSRCIGIGSTKEETLRAYEGEINYEESCDSSIVVAGTMYGGVLFKFKDDLVSSIFIGTAAE